MAGKKSYLLYGTRLRSTWPLPGRESREPGLAEVSLLRRPPLFFGSARHQAARRRHDDEWWIYTRLRDGSDYIRLAELFEFLVSPDGRRIAGLPLARSTPESFQAYLLNQALSFALIKQGLEPLHASVVVIAGRAAAFVGASGRGKSPLAAAFLQAGYPLLTDDLLVLEEGPAGFAAHPGPARIKLYPQTGLRFLGPGSQGTPLNNRTDKMIYPLPDGLHAEAAVPLGAIYALQPASAPSGASVAIRDLAPREAFLEAVRNTFNKQIIDPHRLKRQFELTRRLLSRVPMRSISFPADLSAPAEVIESVVADLK